MEKLNLGTYVKDAVEAVKPSILPTARLVTMAAALAACDHDGYHGGEDFPERPDQHDSDEYDTPDRPDRPHDTDDNGRDTDVDQPDTDETDVEEPVGMTAVECGDRLQSGALVRSTARQVEWIACDINGNSADLNATSVGSGSLKLLVERERGGVVVDTCWTDLQALGAAHYQGELAGDCGLEQVGDRFVARITNQDCTQWYAKDQSWTQNANPHRLNSYQGNDASCEE